MDLDRSLLKEFAKVVNDVGDKPEPKQYVHGTVTTGAGNTKCVMLDGSDTMTPISEVVNAEAGDRVLVSVSNHQATVIGNITFPPSARKEDQAINSANGALEQSNQAMEKAKDAQTKASSAITDSSVASALANEAKSESAKAQEAANTAIQNASEAKDLAQASSNKSDETQQLANQVKDSVTAANKDIGKLKTEVKTANDNIASANAKLEEQAGEIATIKETYSTKVETESTKADLTTEISKKVGELQTTVEKNFATKTENVALEKKLQTQITQNADSISSTVTKVEKLQSDTTEQQKNIDKALNDAQAANTAAGAAKSDAEKAKTAADTAQKAADDATAKAESATTAANLAEQKVTAADKQLQQAKTDLEEAQENLKNVTTRVGATEQEITEAKQKVDTANANVTKALTDVAEAKNAASKANEVASKAQGEATAANKAASDAQTKAADAQKVATNAQQAADKAQSDLAALTNRVTTAETKITQTNEAITAQASKITETSNKIDNLKIGGRNIATSTNLGRLGWLWNMQKGDCTASEVVENGIRTCKLTRGSVTQTGWSVIEFKKINREIWLPNTTYTISMDVKASIDTSMRLGVMISNGTDSLLQSVTNVRNNIKANEWVKLVWVVQTKSTLPSSKYQVIYLTNMDSGPGRWYQFRNLKIEEGTIATAYSPAPEDLENDLHNNYYSKTQTDAQIKVSADKITQSVTEVNKVATSANSKIDNLEIGGRNLILYSDDLSKWAIESGVTLSKEDEWYKITDSAHNSSRLGVYQDITVKPNTTYTLSVYCKNGTTKPYLGGGPTSQANPTFGNNWAIANTENGTRFIKTLTTGASDDAWRVYLSIFPTKIGQYAYFKLPKLEIGNTPTDWTPAPEDQEQYVDDKVKASEKITEESYKALIDQTANDIRALVQKVQKETDANSTSISEISTNFKVTVDGLSATKSAVQTLIDTVNGTISKEELQQYIRWNGGDLELGNSVQPFRCKLSNTELAFYQNKDKVAWISNKELYILKAIIAQSIGCGNFMFVDEGNLGFSLI